MTTDFTNRETAEDANTTSARYVIDRPAHTEDDFARNVVGPATERPSVTVGDRARNYYGKFRIADFIRGLFPILTWLPKYKIKEWLPGDIVSGITVGVVHIPQSISYALIAGLPPVFGLYTTFWPVLIYAFMGTSRHLSAGTFAVVSLLTQPVVLRYFPDRDEITEAVENLTTTASTSTAAETGGFPEIGIDEFYANRVAVASALMMLMGIFQFLFGILRLGMITTYMSQPLIQGFTTGAAMHVALSQMPLIFGLKPKPQIGPGSFYLGCIYILRNIPNFHVPTLVISIISIVFLVIGREINIRYKDRLKVPIPTEVILVIIGILSSHFGNFKPNYGVPVVGTIPKGFPTPRIPNTNILGDIIGDAIGLAIVGFALNIGVSKYYSLKYNYPIDANQELLAYGVTNFVPSFFLCFPNAAALARCQILDQSGGKTQMVGFISVLILLVTILAIGPIFENLPKGVLGCIIFIGLIGIFEQFRLIRPLWKASKPDCVVWVFTFLAVCSLGVDYGFYTAIGFSLFVAILRTQLANSEVLGNVNDTDIYRNSKTYKSAQTIPGVVIFKFNSMLYYVTTENFKKRLFKAIGFVPGEVIERRKKAERKRNAEKKRMSKKNEKQPGSKDSEVVTVQVELNGRNATSSISTIDKYEDVITADLGVHTVIIDCSAFSMIDIVGVKALTTIYEKLKDLGVTMSLANVSTNVRGYLSSGGYYDAAGEESVFISVHDAALFAQRNDEALKDK